WHGSRIPCICWCHLVSINVVADPWGDWHQHFFFACWGKHNFTGGIFVNTFFKGIALFLCLLSISCTDSRKQYSSKLPDLQDKTTKLGERPGEREFKPTNPEGGKDIE